MFTDDLASLLTSLQVKFAHLVGISLGGAVAFQFTMARHALPIERPQEFNAILSQFLARFD